jgi:hypothetical protein
METLNYEMVMIEPMLSSRYRVEFLNNLLSFNSANITKIDLPKFADGEWKDIDIEFINTIDSNTFSQLCKVISRHKTNCDIQICLLGPSGDVLGTWTIEAKIKNVDFGTLDYADNKTDSILKSKATFKIYAAEYVFLT